MQLLIMIWIQLFFNLYLLNIYIEGAGEKYHPFNDTKNQKADKSNQYLIFFTFEEISIVCVLVK